MKVSLSLKYSEDNNLLLNLIKKQPGIELAELSEMPEGTTVITNGPLTELAGLLLRDFTVKNRIERILLVGGTDAYGDVTVRAERNIYDDPQSAQHVFLSGIPIVMFGLNVTEQLENRALAPLVYLLKPEIFDTEECGVFVETQGRITYGATVTDLYSDKQFPDHYVQLVKAIDLNEYEMVLETLI
ncbi:MAG: nucleoside hydrolase [Erysipelotrichaceae bacterium]|nr:nucleoside hydrolase [Erysipelotrichaceae bacterium]